MRMQEEKSMKYRMIFDVEPAKVETILSLLVGEVSNVRVTLSPCKDKTSMSAPVMAPQPQQGSVMVQNPWMPVEVSGASWRPVGGQRETNEEPNLFVDLSDTPKFVRGSGPRPIYQTRTGQIALEIARRMGYVTKPIMARAMEANGFKAQSSGGILNKLSREGVLRETSPGHFEVV